MDNPSKNLKSRFPIVTCCILGVSILSIVFPQVSSILIYDRFAIIDGEIWRLFSSHLVHFTGLHLFYNTIAFGIAGWIIEYKNYQYFILLCLLMAFFISLFLMMMKPNMIYYGGLSGLASGTIYYLALCGLRESRTWRLLCSAILVLIPIKIFLEIKENQSLVIHSEHFIVMPLSHSVGCVVALFLFLTLQFNKNYKHILH